MKKRNEYIVQNLNIIKEKNMLKGNQKKLDKNKDGKISGEDFKMLRKMEQGGATDMAQAILGSVGKTLSDRDKEMIKQIIGSMKNAPKLDIMDLLGDQKYFLKKEGESGKTISDADKQRIERMIGAMKARPQKFKKGGEVKAKPKKRVAKKKTTMTSRGGGAALRGTKFVGVR